MAAYQGIYNTGALSGYIVRVYTGWVQLLVYNLCILFLLIEDRCSCGFSLSSHGCSLVGIYIMGIYLM